MTERADLPGLLIRPSIDGDIPAVRQIYAYHVQHGPAPFETEPPSSEEMSSRRRAVLAFGFPHLVAERRGEVVRHAYASAYRTRPAYCYTAENSIYIRHDYARQGIGAALLDELIAECEAAGLRQLVAVIGDSGNIASIELHRRAGFVPIGTIRSVGYKFDRWLDTVLMQRSLGPGDIVSP